ncbi:MAG TPA: DUF4258 domain-containing protein [Candidatus Hydrogenedentes bacterium]|nr:DUF4258 domain-containing protein [Candidatus Hydrogenedentota bacterium]
MPREKGPPKKADLLKEVRRLVASGYYLETRHAQHRMRSRGITRMEVYHVLRSGQHEEKRDVFKSEHGSWNYAIRGKTLDKDKELRVIVAITQELGKEAALVVTAINVT